MKNDYSSVFRIEMQEFIAYTVSCGMAHKTKANALLQFDKYLVKIGLDEKKLERHIFYDYIRSKEDIKPRTVEAYTGTVRSFAKYLTEIKKYEGIHVPDYYHSNAGKSSFIPYVFTYDEIGRIIECSHKFKPHPTAYPNRDILLPCIITMLYCTGMRIGELISLKAADVDLGQRVIYINEAKNGNKRLVTISESLMGECRYYLEKLSQRKPQGIFFFDSGRPDNEGKIGRDFVYQSYRKMLGMAGIKHVKGKGPRLHDLRVTFCCHSLHKLSKMEIDVNLYLNYLSVYMGHKSIKETQYYLWLAYDIFDDTLTKMSGYTSFVDGMLKGEKTDE